MDRNIDSEMAEKVQVQFNQPIEIGMEVEVEQDEDSISQEETTSEVAEENL